MNNRTVYVPSSGEYLLSLMIRISIEKRMDGPPYTGFYEYLGIRWSSLLDDYIILQPWRKGVKLIILDTYKTQEIAHALQEHRNELEIIAIEPLEKYIQYLARKLVKLLGEQITLRTKTPAKTDLQEIIQKAIFLKPIKYNITKINKNTYHIKYHTKLTQKNINQTLQLITTGIGKNKSLGYGTIIWRSLS